MDISVVILNNNGNKVLIPCIESVMNQVTSCTYEVIVVDNGSTDGSPQQAEARFRGAKFIYLHRNTLYAFGNNVGISNAKGDYIFALSNDTVIDQHCIQGLYECITKYPALGIVQPLIYGIKSNKLEATYNHIKWLMPYSTPTEAGGIDYLNGTALFIRRVALDKVGLFNDHLMYFDDVEFCCRYRHWGWGIKVCREAKLWHYGGYAMKQKPVFTQKLWVNRSRLLFALITMKRWVERWIEFSL